MSSGQPNPYADRPGGSGTGWTHPGFGTQPASPMPPSKRTSTLAITSLISGLLSPWFMCVCALGIIPAGVAIVTGHLARREIRKSGGAIEGSGMSLIGMSIGYLFFTLSLAYIGWVVAMIVNSELGPKINTTFSEDAAESHLTRAENLIASHGTERGYGNRGEAQALARLFAGELKRARDESFAELGQAASQDHFATYCALDHGLCAFLVDVPNYEKLDQASKDELVKIAWLAGQKIAASKLKPGDGLAVALKGQFLYGSVRIGELAPPGGELNSFYEGQKEDLLEFFDIDDESLTPEMPAEQIDLGPDERTADPFAAPAP